MSHAQWAVEVRSIDRGERLFSLNADKLMMPASNMKILTLAAAAETLGWDTRMTTTLAATGVVEGGTLRGNLIATGSGDPTINSRDKRADAVFSEWVDALKSAGITAVGGQVIGDDQAFDEEGLGGGWAWDYLQYGYAAPVGALQYNENVAELIVSPSAQAGDPAMAVLAPGSGLTVHNRAVTGAPGSAVTIAYRRRLDAPVLEVTGSVAADARPVQRTVAVVNPTLFFAESLRHALIARGIPVAGPAADLDDVAAGLDWEAGRRIIATSESPPVRAIATVMMKVSHNLYAETLLKAAGRTTGGLATTGAGLHAAAAALARLGVAEDSYVMVDGSGLSRYNYVTAAALTTVLQRMYADPAHREALLATLPVAGTDGTLERRMRRTPAEGNARAKTGSIANVRTLSGFVRTRDGELLVFAMLANHFATPAATVNWIQDLAVEVLAGFRRTP
jgi:D-alanyl-D-alanine carboxypeptidase/D-alanyl-D-alanine-endopeptidase (penicillin-binding protein 4)